MTDLERALRVNTSPDALERLAAHKDARVRAAVAQNPNAPLASLERLAVRQAEAVLGNPVLDLLMLENANWLSEVPEYALLALLRHPDCPTVWLEWALTQTEKPTARLAVTQNPRCPVGVLEILCAEDGAPGEAAALHVALTDNPTARQRLESRHDLAAAESDAPLRASLRSLEREADIIKDLLTAGLAPDWLLVALAEDVDYELRQMAARHPDLPETALEAFLLNDDEETRRAAHQRAPSAWLEFIERAERGEGLSASECARLEGYEYGRWLIARQANASATSLAALLHDQDWRVRQACAQNPALESAALAQLATDIDKDVRTAVAAHPQASKSMLARLMLDPNDEVRSTARNHPNAPAALRHTLTKLEQNNQSLSSAALERLMRRDESTAELTLLHLNATPAMLRAFATHDSWRLRQAVARNPRTPADVLERLAGDSDYDVRAALTTNPSLPERLLMHFERDPHALVRSGVALNSRSNPAMLERLAQDDETDVRQAVSVNPNLAASLLERLACDAQEPVRRAVALHPRTPPATLELLSRDAEADVRAAVADHPAATAACAKGIFGASFDWKPLYQRVKNLAEIATSELEFLCDLNDFAQHLALQHPHCPAVLLERFAASDDWRLRQRVAQHENTSPALLEVLGQDGDYDVREAVARHPRAPHATLERLVRDDYAQVRRGLVSREQLEPDLAQWLAWDEDDEVLTRLDAHGHAPLELRERAGRAVALEPAELAQLGLIGTPLALRLLAQNPATPAATLRELALAEDWRVRLEVARHTHCQTETLEVLASDNDLDVRRAVASNPQTPSAVLLSLLNDDDASVRRAALIHPALPLERRLKATRTLLLRALIAGGLTRLVALEHPALPQRELQKQRYRCSTHWLERLAVARNPAAPKDVLEILGHDANRLVHREANRALAERGMT